MLKNPEFLTCLLLLAAAIPPLASASTETPREIQQPIFTHDAGITICPIIFAVRGDVSANPGSLLALTFAENRIWTEQGFENRNEANLAGLRMQTVQREESPQQGGAHGFSGDTLCVALDVSLANTSGGRAGLRELVSVTHACMLANAALEIPGFHFLEIEISGSEALAEFEGVFPLRASSGNGE